MRPPYETFKGPTCKGSYALGTACGTCEKCAWEREQMALHASPSAGEGADRIRGERLRHLTVEGWSEEHDDQHVKGEIAAAAACYARHASYQSRGFTPNYVGGTPPDWPWEPVWWKPALDPVRNLEKAGALAAAEIDRLLRARRDEMINERNRRPRSPDRHLGAVEEV